MSQGQPECCSNFQLCLVFLVFRRFKFVSSLWCRESFQALVLGTNRTVFLPEDSHRSRPWKGWTLKRRSLRKLIRASCHEVLRGPSITRRMNGHLASGWEFVCSFVLRWLVGGWVGCWVSWGVCWLVWLVGESVGWFFRLLICCWRLGNVGHYGIDVKVRKRMEELLRCTGLIWN